MLGRYRGCGARARAHVLVRAATAPLGAVAELVPPGTVLDYGCGHGLLALRLAEAGRTVHAVDVDGDKVDTLRRAAAGLPLTAEVVAPGWRPEPGRFDVVVVADVLYLLGRDEALATVGDLARAARHLVVKEMADRPRWKAALNRGQEHLAVRVLGLTAGGAVEVVPVADLAGALRADGHAVVEHRLDRWRPHPHAALVAGGGARRDA